MAPRGLYNKYEVWNVEEGQEISGFYFVLRPDRDPAAREALGRYAACTKNRALQTDLVNWLNAHPIQVFDDAP